MSRLAFVKCAFQKGSRCSALFGHDLEKYAEIKGFDSLPLLALIIISHLTLTLHRRTFIVEK